MAYSEKILEAQKKALSYGIATKILDLMDKLRLNSNDKDSRRWVWELIQNAKDVSNETGKVKININFNTKQKTLEFSHNGKAFTSENITFLIEQVSTKDRKGRAESEFKTIGKFGTGFLTTHLLSEIVTISGVLKEPDEPYKQFNIFLDRSGKDIDSIIESVENSLEDLNAIDTYPSLENFNANDLNTKFTYNLDEDGVYVAKQGIYDLNNNIIFSLVFLPEIETVYLEDKNIKYKLKNESIALTESIKIFSVIETSSVYEKEHKIIVISNETVAVATIAEVVNGQVFLKEISDKIPKLFCHFPLIGTEHFPYPFIINSPYFNPTEPRDGIYLTENKDEKILENKKIISMAFELYKELLIYASNSNWGNMHLFASSINSIINEDWLSSHWVRNELVNPIKEKILITPIVDTQLGQKVAIQDNEGNFNVWFPTHKDIKIRNRIGELCSYWIPEKLPEQSQISNWYRVLWSDCKNLTLDVIAKNIQSQENTDKLQQKINSKNVIEWLNLYYQLITDEGTFIEEVIGDKYSVIPNQNGFFRKRTQLNIDKNIDEELKNVSFILGEDYREKLLNKDITTGGEINFYCIEQRDILSKINEIVIDTRNERINEASYYMISLFPNDDDSFPIEREMIYNFCKVLFPEFVNEKRKIVNWSKEIWENVDKVVMKNLVKEISDNRNINNLQEKLLTNSRIETLKWLDKLISFLNENNFEYLVNDKETTILPNQNGEFRIKDVLFLDDGTIDEDLKDISFELGLDLREELLCIEIYLELPDSRTKNQTDLANEITKLVKEKVREPIITDDIKQVFRKLLKWFNDNQEKTKDIFSDLLKIKHKMYDDIEIAENMEKAVKYDKLMQKYNIVDHTSLERILETTMTNGEVINKKELTEEILAQLGIFSPMDLENAFKDKVFADNFIHVSDKNKFKYEFVQKILNRSIENVLKYLSSKSEYNVEDFEEIAKTIYSVTKNGEDIYIIIRPADYDQIIIYYDSERDLLDYEKDCELWIDNGQSHPQKITFGKILKITGINKIPLRKV